MIIFLYGEDKFRLREKAKAIQEKFLAHNRSGSGLSVIDCEEKKQTDRINEIIHSLGACGLFCAKQLIIVKKAISILEKEATNELVDFLRKQKNLSSDNSTVVLFTDEGEVNNKSLLFKYLQTNAKKQEFNFLTGKKLEEWIVQRVAIYNPKATINREAIECLIAYVGSNLITLNSEIQKLSTYTSQGTIGKKEVELLVRSQLNESIFEAIEALSSGDKKKALHCFYQQLAQGEDVFYLLSMYTYQFRNLLKVAQWREDGLLNSYEIAKRTKLHSYVVQKAMSQLRNFTLSKLKDIYKKLQNLDFQVKTGKMDIKLALNKFIAEI